MGLAWVNPKGSVRQAHKALNQLAFKLNDTCFRNDGVTGSSPVSGTTNPFLSFSGHLEFPTLFGNGSILGDASCFCECPQNSVIVGALLGALIAVWIEVPPNGFKGNRDKSVRAAR